MTEKEKAAVNPKTENKPIEKAAENEESQTAADEVTVPVKFNKVTKNITLDEAARLAQKGMKFDMIRENYERIVDLASKRDLSVSDFIDAIECEDLNSRKAKLLEMCSGNEELADHILELEKNNGKEKCDFDELHNFFPEIKSFEQLPDQVSEAVKLKGTKPLDEYLRFRLREKRARLENEKNRRDAEFSGIGPQRRNSAGQDPANAEFLRGIWNI